MADFTPTANLTDDCDLIRLDRVPNSSSMSGPTDIYLALAGRVDWYKALYLYTPSQPFGIPEGIEVSGRDARSFTHLTLNAADAAAAQLVFVKTKWLGTKTKTYQINGLAGFENETLTFTWERDSC